MNLGKRNEGDFHPFLPLLLCIHYELFLRLTHFYMSSYIIIQPAIGVGRGYRRRMASAFGAFNNSPVERILRVTAPLNRESVGGNVKTIENENDQEV